jgi:tetratricopeptide (TPR) repeat protein
VHDFTDLPQDQQWLTALVLLSDVCAFLKDTRRAALLYELLLPYAKRVAIIGPGAACYGAVARSLGLLAATLSRLDEAEQHFLDALAMNERLRAKPFVVRTQYEYAQMLVTRGRPGDRARALELIDNALATARALGLKRLEEKIKSKAVVSSQHPVASSLSDSELPNSGPPDCLTVRLPDCRPRETSDLGPRTSDSAEPNLFRRDGDHWTISYAGTTIRLNDAKGLHHIACLLREPGREFHVMDLLAMTDPPSSVSASKAAEKKFRNRSVPSNVQVARHRTREAEKGRKAVTNRIRNALTKIQRVHPKLWRHLFTTIKTGTFCSYTPEKPTFWEL